jgi:hypothetical protein
MRKSLPFHDMLISVRQAFDHMPEYCSEQNIQYTLTEAGMSAFAVSYMQSPLFLAHQPEM